MSPKYSEYWEHHWWSNRLSRWIAKQLASLCCPGWQEKIEEMDRRNNLLTEALCNLESALNQHSAASPEIVIEQYVKHNIPLLRRSVYTPGKRYA